MTKTDRRGGTRPAIALLAAIGLSAGTLLSSQHEDDLSGKILVAHRGASAYAPEHTLAAYRLALEQGADFVEQDLGVTKDGVLVCLHDDTLERTTDVEERFPDRARDIEFNGERRRRWLLADFTLAEVRTLDAGRWFDPRFAGERVPTFDEAVALVGGRAGLFPELKSPAIYRDLGIDIVALFRDALRRHGLTAAGPRRLIVQTFDEAAVRALAAALPDVPRVLLVEASQADRYFSDEALQDLRTYATGIGPAKAAIDGRPDRVRRAHAAGLTVVPWTFRSSDRTRFPDVSSEMRYYLTDLGADGVFTDNPDRFPRPAAAAR